MPQNTTPSEIDYGNLDRLAIRGLDQALYVATCFAANSPTKEVVILCKIVNNSEVYAVFDAPFTADQTLQSDGWRTVFALKAIREEK